jgi:DNA repair exonuclease SbcCD ATPase subunit
MDKLTLNQTIYKLKSKSKQMNIKELLEKANQTLKDAKEDLNNLREIDYNAAKVKYILESANLTGLTEEQIAKVKKLLADSKDKAHSLNYKLLEKIVDKLNELNNNLTDKIDVKEIQKKVDDFLTDCENLEKKIEKFPNSTEELRYNVSYNKVKDFKPKDLYPILDQMDDFIQKEFENVNETGTLFASILQLIAKKFQTLPKDSDPADLNKRISELFKETAKELKEDLKELVKDTRIEVYQDKIKEINVKVDEKIKNKTELSEFIEYFKNKSDTLDEKLKNMTDNLEGKTLNEIIENIRGRIKNMNRDNAAKIRREFYKMLLEASPISDIFNTTALEKLKKRIDQLDNLPKVNKTKIKEQIEDIISKLKKLREYIKNNDAESITPSLKSIDLVTLIEELRKIDTSKVNVEEEIKKVKRLKELLDEMNTILDSSAGKAVLEALIKSSKLRNLSVKKAKKAKKFRRADEEKEDYLTCKIDDSFVNSPQDKQLSANTENINSRILLENENYDVYVDENLQLDLEESETNCGYDSVTQTKGNITYIRHSTPLPDYDKNRVVYDLYAKIDQNYKYPNFFYILTKTKVKYNSSNVEKEEELDSYCVLEDDNDRDNARFKCYAYTEDMTSFSEADDDIKSSYIIIADSNSTDNGDNGKSGTYFNRKKSSGGLGAGAIVGIIIACLAVLIAIICTIVCLNKRASTAAVVARQSESNNHIQISSMSGQYPVKV